MTTPQVTEAVERLMKHLNTLVSAQSAAEAERDELKVLLRDAASRERHTAKLLRVAEVQVAAMRAALNVSKGSEATMLRRLSDDGDRPASECAILDSAANEIGKLRDAITDAISSLPPEPRDGSEGGAS